MAGLQADDAILGGLAEAKHDEARHGEFLDEKHDLKHRSSSPRSSFDDIDDVHAGDEFPTDEEKATLRHIADHVPWTAYLIALIELAERFSYYGTTVVFTNFIQQGLPPGSRTGAGGTGGQSGALGMGQRASTGLTTFNSFWVYVTPLFGAYIADTYWGRYKTISWSVAVAQVGHVLLIICALPGVIEHSGASLGVFIFAIIVMGIGTGGFKSNVSPLVAEQYRRTKLTVRETKGERVIIDPILTASRIYMYFYLFINIGALVGQIGMTYAEQHVGFWLSFTLPTIVFFLAPIVLFVGRKRYVRSPPQGSVLPGALRILRYCFRGTFSLNPVRFWRNIHADGFWDKAKPSVAASEGFPGKGNKVGSRPKWMTYDDQWVDEVRRGFKACIVFVWFPVYWLTYNQMNNNLTSQAATMVTNGIPNDVLSNLNPFALIILIPLCDIVVYPFLRRMGVRLTPLRKITAGFFAGAAAMCWAAVIQHYIYQRNPCGNMAATCEDAEGNNITSDLNVWAQTGSYVLIALSEVLASITGLEYAFTKAPKNMRSLVMSVFLFMNAISSALGFAFVSLSADPLLVWNYAVMGILAASAGVLFWLTFRHLDQEEDALNELAEGRVNVGSDITLGNELGGGKGPLVDEKGPGAGNKV